jgi:1,4-dihydroxy-2-naphthoate octaprenyltransferase
LIEAGLRTLPLSVSGIIVVVITALASYEEILTPTDVFNWSIFGFAMLTFGFQILSNFANDYGDGVKGQIMKKRALNVQFKAVS